MAAQRLPTPPAEQPAEPPLCPFEVGKTYTKEDIYRIFEVPAKQRGGNWNTGYTKFDGRWFIFSNIGTPGRTGHDYGDRLLDGRMVWFGKTKSHIGQSSITDIVSGNSTVFIFYRRESREPFTFAGIGKARSVKDTTPVEVEWDLVAAAYVPLPLLVVPPAAQSVATTKTEYRDQPAAMPRVNEPVSQATPAPTPAWISPIFAQRSYQQATVHAGRHRPTDALMAQILAALDAAPGRQLPLSGLAKAIGCPEIRIGGILAQASRILNLDGYLVLQISTDRGFVRLDKELAIRQFIPGSGS